MANVHRRAANPPNRRAARVAIRAMGGHIVLGAPLQQAQPRPSRVTLASALRCVTCSLALHTASAQEKPRVQVRVSRTGCSGCGAAVCAQHQNTSVTCDTCAHVELEAVHEEEEED
jgi:hypothetical protein